jgi:IS5 family transposase
VVVVDQAHAGRATVATLKRSYGWRRVRYRGLARNAAHLHLLCIAMNLRRAERLTA